MWTTSDVGDWLDSVGLHEHRLFSTNVSIYLFVFIFDIQSDKIIPVFYFLWFSFLRSTFELSLVDGKLLTTLTDQDLKEDLVINYW